MAQCQCGAELTGRRRKCDACKKRPGRAAKTTASPMVEDPDTPAGLHDRGRAVWTMLGQQLDTPAGQLALEAARSADRLDELDAVVAGKGVLNLLQFRLGLDWTSDEERKIEVKLQFANVLSELRAQQLSFKMLLTQLSDVVPAPAAPAVPPTPAPKAAVKKSPLDELAERRKRK